MDNRFQPQQAMFYEASLEEASRLSTNDACLAIRTAHIDLDFYEREMIDTGIIGLLNSIALVAAGFALATLSLAGGVAVPLAVAGALTGVLMVAVGGVDFQIYSAHIVSGGNYFSSRKAMEAYENAFWNPTTGSDKTTKCGLKKSGDYALEKRITQLGGILESKQLPDRDDLGMAREFLTILDEKLECRTPLLEAEARPASVGDQWEPAPKSYDGILTGDMRKELDKLASSVADMLEKLKDRGQQNSKHLATKKPNTPISPPAVPLLQSPPPPPPIKVKRLATSEPLHSEAIFTGDTPNLPGADGPMVA